MTNVLPFHLPRDRVILYRSAPTGFCLVWVPADDPTARVVVWDGADYGDALAALAEWERDGADVSEELAGAA
mgnify:CR=1 FL=1